MKKIITFTAFLFSTLTFASTGGGPTSGSLPINENISILVVFFSAIVTFLFFLSKKKSI